MGKITPPFFMKISRIKYMVIVSLLSVSFVFSNVQRADAEIWDGIEMAIGTVVNSVGDLIMSYFGPSGTTEDIGVPVVTLSPEMQGRIGQSSGGSTIYKTPEGYSWLWQRTGTLEEFFANSSVWLTGGQMNGGIGYYCNDIRFVLPDLPDNYPGSPLLELEAWTDSYPCHYPDNNNTVKYAFRIFLELFQSIEAGCPPPLVEVSSVCLYPDEQGYTPILTFNADGTVRPVGVEGDYPVGSNVCEGQMCYEIADVFNSDLQLQGTAEVSKPNSETDLTITETYDLPDIAKDDGSFTSGNLRVTKTIGSDGQVVTQITQITYDDASTPSTGDRLAPNTWVNNSGKPVHNDTAPGTSGGAVETSAASSGDIQTLVQVVEGSKLTCPALLVPSTTSIARSST